MLIYKSLLEGGLGIQNISEVNKARLAKLFWQVLTKKIVCGWSKFIEFICIIDQYRLCTQIVGLVLVTKLFL